MPRLPILLLLPVLAACATAAPDPDGMPSGTPATMAATPAAGIPSGTYTTTIADADVPASAPADMRSQIVGAWEIVMDGSGHAMVRFGGRQVVDAPYTVSGNEITFTEDTGEFACRSSARYTWQASGGQLRFTKVEDSCDGRAMVLTAHPLTRRM